MRNQFRFEDVWDDYWQRKVDYEKVYSNEGRIASNLESTIDFQNKCILEVGAGTGRDSAELARRGAMVVVLDKSSRAMVIIREVMRRENIQLFPVIGDVKNLPFTTGSFQVVFHQGLLEHFLEPNVVLHENRRVLETGGLVLVDVPQKYHPYTVVKHILMTFGRWFAGWETEYTIAGLSSTMKQAGFREIVHRYGTWMNPSFFYRSVREVLLGLGCEIPMYPSSPAIMRRTRASLKKKMEKTQVAFYTYHTIGIIAKK